MQSIPNVVVLGAGCHGGILSEFCFLWKASIGGHLRDVRSWVGVSDTAYLAVMLAMSVDHTQILEDLTQLTDLGGLVPYRNLFGTKGSPDQIMSRLTQRVTQKFGKIPTLKEMYEETRQRVVLVSFNRDTSEVVYLYDETYPHLLITQAVSMSLAMPGVFNPIRYLDSTFIDGSIAKPYPVDAFISDESSVTWGLYVESVDTTQPTSVDPMSLTCASLRKTLESQRLWHQLQSIMQCDGLRNVSHFKFTVPLHSGVGSTSTPLQLLLDGWNTLVEDMVPNSTNAVETPKPGNPENQD